jgi:peptidyl-prolyl cis-trans isomerase SurA
MIHINKDYSMKRFTTLSKVLILIFLVNASLIESIAQPKKTRQLIKDDEVFASVGPEKITYKLLESAFQKNMNRKNVKLTDVARDSLLDFLHLYINYRLKVLDAIDRGYDKDSAVIADIEQNRKILAESYYYDKVLVEPNVDHLQKLRQHEIKFAYILIPFDNTATVPDTAETYSKGMEALKKLAEGKDFGEVALEYSVDKESAKNGGVVERFITGGRVQRPIEEALYTIKNEGEVYPQLIRTKYGYFIVKLIKKEPRVKVLISHILLSKGMDTDSIGVIAKADSLLKVLRQGADFSKIAELHSDDPSTAIKGGSWGAYYSRSSGFEGMERNVAAPIENVIFKMKDGEISDKVFTDYGIHIVRRDSTKFFDPSEERDELKKLYKRLYFEDDKKSLLDSLKYKFGFNINYDALSKFLSLLDTTKTNLDTAWKRNLTEEINNFVAYKILDKNVTFDSFINELSTKNELKGTSLNYDGITRAINKIVTPIVYNEATKNLEKEYPDFAALMREFRDGILLFRVEAIEVWDKLKFDSAKARVYWDSTKTRYMTEPKYDIDEIYVLSDSLANDIYKRLQDTFNFANLAAEHTQRSGFREKKGAWGLVSVKDNGLAKLAQANNAKPGDLMTPMSYEKGFSIIKVNSFEPVRQKTFEEAISDFAPTFQDLMQKYYTEIWLNEIKKKFLVKINDKVINKITAR